MCPTVSPESIRTGRKGRVGKTNKAHDSVQLISFFPWPGKGGGRLLSRRVISPTKLVFSLHGERGRNQCLIDNNV